jgi:hypothetical protein
MVKRTVKHGCVVVLGRTYYVPAFQRQKLEGMTLKVDDEGVVRSDRPKWGVFTASSIRAFDGYRYVATLHLDGGAADRIS